MQPLCRARLKNGFLLAAHLEFYRIYFWGLNGHITGPEICLNLNFISSPRRPHLSPCHDLPAPISQCDFFSLSPLTTYRRNHISVHPLSVWGSMQVWEGDHVGYNECHSFLFDIYFYYIVVQKKMFLLMYLKPSIRALMVSVSSIAGNLSSHRQQG